jgi:hypothetical protein
MVPQLVGIGLAAQSARRQPKNNSDSGKTRGMRFLRSENKKAGVKPAFP